MGDRRAVAEKRLNPPFNFKLPRVLPCWLPGRPSALTILSHVCRVPACDGKAFRHSANLHTHYRERHPSMDYWGMYKRLAQRAARRRKEAGGETVVERRRQTMSARRATVVKAKAKVAATSRARARAIAATTSRTRVRVVLEEPKKFISDSPKSGGERAARRRRREATFATTVQQAWRRGDFVKKEDKEERGEDESKEKDGEGEQNKKDEDDKAEDEENKEMRDEDAGENQVGEDVPVEAVVEVPKVKQVKTEVVELTSDEEDLVEVAARRYLKKKGEAREAKRRLKTLLLH